MIDDMTAEDWSLRVKELCISTTQDALDIDTVRKIRTELPRTLTPESIVDILQSGDDDDFLYRTLETLGIYSLEVQDNTSKLSKFLEKELDIPSRDWDWLNGDTNAVRGYNRILRTIEGIVAHSKDSKVSENVLRNISYHLNPNLPWTSTSNSQIVWNIIRRSSYINLWMLNHVNLWVEIIQRERLIIRKAFSSQSIRNRVSKAGATIGGLNPRRGYGGVGGETSEEDGRRKWKESSNVKSLSVLFTLIETTNILTWLHTEGILVTSFLLNLLDDHEPVFKVQGLHLLNKFLSIPNRTGDKFLTKTGLKDEFLQSTENCLHFLPNLTPVLVSKNILNAAYNSIFLMIGKEHPLKLVEILNVTLSSTFYIRGNPALTSLMTFLLNQLLVMIELLGPKVLICMSRLNFSLSQVMIDPSIIEVTNEPALSCLEVQRNILKTFTDLEDKEAKRLILGYKYDFLVSWAILAKRDHSSRVKVAENVDHLMKLSKDVNDDTIRSDLRDIEESYPELKHVLFRRSY